MTDCWTITDGSAGMISQVKGLAEALGLSYENKICKRVFPHYGLPGWLYFGCHHFLTKDSDSVAPPYPRVIITCGRRSIPLALSLKKASPTPMTIIHVQKPDVPLSWFDWVVAPEHDKISGPNLLTTKGAIHHVTEKKLEDAAEHFKDKFATFSRPRYAVMIGGSNSRYNLTLERMKDLVDQLQQILDQTEGSLLITPSRRTGEENLAYLSDVMKDNPRVYVFDGTEENPYMGFLALADGLFITNDSVSMISEACFTGKPVYTLAFKDNYQKMIQLFIEKLERDGHLKQFSGRIDESWTSVRLHDMNNVITPILDSLKQ